MTWHHNKQAAMWALLGPDATATIGRITVDGKHRYEWCVTMLNGTGVGNAPTLRQAKESVARAIKTMEGES